MGDPSSLTRFTSHPLLQDNIVVGRASSTGSSTTNNNDNISEAIDSERGAGGGDAGAACGLVVLAGAGSGSDADAAVNEPPTVLGVAYRAGCLDLVLVPAGVAPR